MTGNVSALTALFAATLGSPVVKVAAFSYGVRRAAAKRAAAGVEREIKADRKASARAARADRAAARGARRAGGVPGPCGPCSEASGRRRSGTRTVRRCARGWRNGPGSAGGSRRSASARRRWGWGSWPVRVEGIVAAVQAEPRAQLVLALGHPFPDIGSEVADGLGQAAERAGQRTGQRAGHALGVRQWAEDREVLAGARSALELHEDEVPDLEVPVLVRDRTAVPAVNAVLIDDLEVRAFITEQAEARTSRSSI